jgi:hypothetical protein
MRNGAEGGNMPISSISSASGMVIADKTISNLSQAKRMGETEAVPKVPETKRISVAEAAPNAQKNASAQTATSSTKKGDSEAPPAPNSPVGGKLDLKA